MPDVWVSVAVAAAIALALGLTLVARRTRGAGGRSRPEPHTPGAADGREERLARRLALLVGCSSAQALPAVRREIEFAPGQTDETLLKRAAYHYRRDLPERSCPVYRDRAPG
jgi:hypothetical protein